MGRAKSKRGKGKPKDETFKKPENTGKIASQYYDKYGLKDKPVSVGGSTGVTVYGGNSGSQGSTWTTKNCKHWQEPLELAEGITIHASAYRDHPTKDWFYPQLGVYFADSWDDFSPKQSMDRTAYSTGWQGPRYEPISEEKKVDQQLAHIEWRDYGCPVNTGHTLDVLEYALNQAPNKFVEIGCIGGHGRTGTAIAAMLIMLGQDDADKAMQWVWTNYCEHAIESTKQEDWLWDLADDRHPETAPAIRKAFFSKKEKEKKKNPHEGTGKGGGTPLAGTSIGASTQTSSHSNSSEDDGGWEEYDRWWMKQACQEYQVLIDEGMSATAAYEQICDMYHCTEQELLEALGVDLGNDDSIPDEEPTRDDSVSYDDWQLINEHINRENTKSGRCGLCEEPTSSCSCFDGWTGYAGVF